MNESYWQKTSQHPCFKQLNKDIKTDILIIGGGLSGISCAYQLKETGKQITIVEKNLLGSHTSGHTTAKITLLQGLIYQKLVKHYNIETAYLYYQSQKEAIKGIKDLIEKEKIDCCLKECTMSLYTDDLKNVGMLEKEQHYLQLFGETVFDNQKHLKTISLHHQYIFHPLKYLYHLVECCQKKNVQFYEHSRVEKIIKRKNDFLVYVQGHRIICQDLIHASRYPFIKKGFYFLKMFQSLESVDLKQRTGNQCTLSIDLTESYRPLKNHALVINSKSKDWFAQDTIPLRGIPYMGRYKEHEYFIYGFQKWGMTNSFLASKIIKDLYLNNDNAYLSLFSCHYYSLSYSKIYLKQMLHHLYLGYVKFHFHTKKNLQRGQGGLMKINHKLYAVYLDRQGINHYFSPYCPHLKGLLSFDEKNQIWHCPCHQSVFDCYGKLIEGPCLKDMNKQGNTYTFLYSVVLVVVVAALLSIVSLSLQPRQNENRQNEKRQNILSAIHISSTAANSAELFDKYIKEQFIINSKGDRIEGKAFDVNIEKQYNLPVEKRELPVFVANVDGATKYILPIYGAGLWGPIWGYISLDDNKDTVYGTYFSHASETPGLGAEIATEHFQNEFVGKKTLENGAITLGVVKNGKVEKPDYQVDGISGGTITSVGVDAMLKSCLNSYLSFLTK